MPDTTATPDGLAFAAEKTRPVLKTIACLSASLAVTSISTNALADSDPFQVSSQKEPPRALSTLHVLGYSMAGAVVLGGSVLIANTAAKPDAKRAGEGLFFGGLAAGGVSATVELLVWSKGNYQRSLGGILMFASGVGSVSCLAIGLSTIDFPGYQKAELTRETAAAALVGGLAVGPALFALGVYLLDSPPKRERALQVMLPVIVPWIGPGQAGLMVGGQF